MTQRAPRSGRSAGAAAPALHRLKAVRPGLATALDRMFGAVADEACANEAFADRLAGALAEASLHPGPRPRGSRRDRGPWDPFEVYAQHGEARLRERLSSLELEQLRDIVAEHGMDTDRLAMKWRDPGRVVDRIIDRVVDRAAKGDAFRPPTVE